MILEAQASKGNPTVVRLDLANVYGSIPHPFRFRTLPDPSAHQENQLRYKTALFTTLQVRRPKKSVSQLAAQSPPHSSNSPQIRGSTEKSSCDNYKSYEGEVWANCSGPHEWSLSQKNLWWSGTGNWPREAAHRMEVVAGRPRCHCRPTTRWFISPLLE